MVRLRSLLILSIPMLVIGLSGCGKKPPEPTGEPYEPSPQMKDMANQMMESYKKGEVNKAK